MRKEDVIAGAKGKPTEFAHGEFRCLLRPLNFTERRDLIAFVDANVGVPGSGLELQERLITLAVCDEAGARLLDRGDLDGFAIGIGEAIADEVARRNGLDGKAAGEPGKGESPTTTS